MRGRSPVETLRTALAEMCRCEPEALHDDTVLSDIGLDSLTLVAVLGYVEALHGAVLTPGQTGSAFAARTLRDLCACIDATPASSAARPSAVSDRVET